jgi:glycogen debranching enzyme
MTSTPLTPETEEKTLTEHGDIHLFPYERLVHVETLSLIKPEKYPSALKELEKLTGVSRASEIGDKGPAMASRAIEGREGHAALRLYEALFGRDSIKVSAFLLDKYPKLAHTTILKLAELQGVHIDSESEEEPGRIIHECREPDDPIALEQTRKYNWGWPYYGSIDATVSYIQLVADFCEQEGAEILNEVYAGRDRGEHTLRESLHMAIDWLTMRLDQNKEGLLESKRSNPHGILNQVWKDSPDSYFHKDGTLANPHQGVASIEVQVSAYDALRKVALMYPEHAADLNARAEKIKSYILDFLWTEDERGGYFALGSDRDDQGNIRKLDIRTSNMGHVLNSDLLLGDDPQILRKRDMLIKTLFSPEMLNASGIRTLSNKEKRFRPGAYHNGSVWLWDTYQIALGLEKHKCHKLAEELEHRTWNVVNKFHMFLEYASGGDSLEPEINTRTVDVFDEERQTLNRVEQPPQEVQAWTVAAILATKHKKGIEILSPYQRQKIEALRYEDDILEMAKKG